MSVCSKPYVRVLRAVYEGVGSKPCYLSVVAPYSATSLEAIILMEIRQ